MQVDRYHILFLLVSTTLFYGIIWAGSLSVTINQGKYFMDAGQNSTLNVSVTGGNGNYICLWSYYGYNTPQNVHAFANQSCSVLFYGNSSDLASPDIIDVTVNDLIGDTGSSQTALAVKPAMIFSITPSANDMYLSGSISISNSTSLGEPPYSYYYIYPNGIVENGNGFTFNSPGTYNIIEVVTDSDQAQANAGVNIIVENIPTLSFSNTPTIDSGQYETLSAYEVGEEQSYTYNFLVYNSVTNTLVFNGLIAGSNTFTFKVTGNVGNTIYANVMVSEPADLDWINVSSGMTNVITVNSPLLTPTLSFSNTPTVNPNGWETLTANLGGGTPPYAINFIVYNSVTNAMVFNNILTWDTSTSNTFTFEVALGAGNTIYANVFVTDAGFSSANSILTPVVTVSSGLYTPTLTTTLANAGTVTDGAFESDKATLSGGHSPTGTITFYTFLNTSSCTGTRTQVGSPISVSGNGNYSSSSFGPYSYVSSWDAVYSGDSNNNGATSPCEPLFITNPKGTYDWAGYQIIAQESPPPSSVNGSWIVEATSFSIYPKTYGSQWIGFGGTDSNLLQIGTESDTFSYIQSYSAFYEEVNESGTKAPPVPINGITIEPGDRISASISLSNQSMATECFYVACKWTLKIADLTRDNNKTINVTYQPDSYQADWIQESASVFGTQSQYPISIFGVANFGSGYTNVPYTDYVTINSIKYSIGSANLKIKGGNLFEYNLNESPLDLATATVSNLTYNGTSFKVYGPEIPALYLGTPLFSNYLTNSTVKVNQKDTIYDSGARGGTGLYSYQWLVSNSPLGPYANISLQCTTYAYTECNFSSPNPGAYYLKLMVTDNATLETYISGSACILVTNYDVPGYGCTALDNESFTESVSAQVPTDPLTMNITYEGDAPITANGIGNVMYTICSTPSTCLPAGTYLVNVTDTNTMYSESWPLTIVSPPNVLILPANSVLDQGQQIYINATVTNGTGAFNYQWYNATSGTPSAIANQIEPVMLFNATNAGTFKYYVVAKDIGTNTVATAVSNNAIITVEPALTANAMPSYKAIYTGSNTIFIMNSIVAGGTGNFVYQWYNFSSGLSAVPIANQTSNTLTLPFNAPGDYLYSLEVTDEGTTTSPKASAISIPANITVENPIVPRNLQAYLPITLFNYQHYAVAPNAPLMIGVTNSFAGGAIGFNALAYQQYETCNLNNAEFFFANGTIINSWLEGNAINEMTANAICTSSASANALADSSNIIYWVEYNWPSTFLPANTGTNPTSNTIYIGWAGNFISSSNTLFSQFTGEAPQLSCNKPTNTIVGCGAGQYGEYDNGNTIFTLYYNFIGSSAPAGLVESGTYMQANGIYIRAKKSASVNTINYYTPGTSNTFEGLVKYGGYPTAAGWDDFGAVAPGTGSCKKTNNGICWILTGNNAGVFQPEIGSEAGAEITYNTNWNVYSAYWPSYTEGVFSLNYGPSNTVSATTSLPEPFGISTGASSTNAISIQWIRIRIPPPNDVQPSSVYGNVET